MSYQAPVSDSLKIIVVGMSGVGKTSLIGYYAEQRFDTTVNPTVAPAYQSHIVDIGNERMVDLQIWDTAGQEQYQSISQMFYRGANAALVCFDRERADTVPEWVRKVRSSVPNCLIYLVLTKVDLLTKDQLSSLNSTIMQLTHQVNSQDVFITSARTGDGVSEAFLKVAKSIELPEMIKTIQPKPQQLSVASGRSCQC